MHSDRTQYQAQQKFETIIFGTTTPAGKAFDLVLLAVIAASVSVVMFDSIASVHAKHG